MKIAQVDDTCLVLQAVCDGLKLLGVFKPFPNELGKLDGLCVDRESMV